jgi:hypothetical protein
MGCYTWTIREEGHVGRSQQRPGSGRDAGVARGARLRAADRGHRARSLPARAADRPGAALGRAPALLRHHRVPQHDPRARPAADARRAGARVSDPFAGALERARHGGAGEPRERGARRPHRHVRERRHAVRRRLQSLLEGPRPPGRRRPALRAGALLAGSARSSSTASGRRSATRGSRRTRTRG